MMTRKDCIPTDIAVIMVTPMDKNGYFNFGVCAVANWGNYGDRSYSYS